MGVPDDTVCACILSTYPEWEGHTEGDHRHERCSGSWTFDPPCGGCINCIARQAYYYASEATDD